MKKRGVIYILTNPSFPDYIKIGYTSNLERRLKELNRSETVPYAFRVYAVYEAEGALTDKELHRLIDIINRKRQYFRPLRAGFPDVVLTPR